MSTQKTLQDVYKDTFLDFLDVYRMNDDILAEEYENTSPQKRASIKTALSFYFAMPKLLKQSTLEGEEYWSHKQSGAEGGLVKRCSSFLVVFCEKQFDAPARFLSALSSAVLAGLEEIYIFFQERPSASLLSTLELAGLENIFVLEGSEQEQINILEKTFFSLSEKGEGQGRFLYFSRAQKENGTSSLYDILENKACQFNIVSLYENIQPRIYAYKEQEEMLTFAYGAEGAEYIFQEGEVSEADATFHGIQEHLYASQKNAHLSFIPSICVMQNYHKGMELCFLHPIINVEFFFNTNICVYLTSL